MAQPLDLGGARPLDSVADGPSELGSWRGEGVGVGQILEALGELRRAEPRAATRTSVVNLVMLADDEEEAQHACSAMHRLETGHPGRTIVLIRDDERAEPSLDAEVSLHGASAGGHAVWSEDVRLRVRGALGDHLYSLVEPLTLPDVPVVVWFLTRLPRPSDPMLAAAGFVVVDTKDAADDMSLSRIAALAETHHVMDLSWIRLQPWRELMGNLFEVKPFRPFLDGVRAVSIQGKAGPRQLMAGWLSSRLALPPSTFTISDARHLMVCLTCDHDGISGTFTVDRVAGERLVRSKAEIVGMAPYEDRLVLHDDSLPWSLGKALARLEPHPSYGPTLRCAVSFAS
ncbi:MAG TPA: glucose-6-phosphate dehydrogenase assembly protein OpcA [Acidimicrobiales bacterium]|nr:glucose-6-phosphate dehydrogenase assembly protein OpcA [Acidimicrobiales bacterium]